MGVYLHPTLKDPTRPESLETLAGVPAGTTAALEELEQAHPNRMDNYSSAQERFFQALFAIPIINRLHSFSLFGWGRTTRAFDAAVQKHGYDSAVGSVPLEGNRELVSELLLAQGLQPDEITPHISGLCWG